MRIHITSFKDNDSELLAIKNQNGMPLMMPPPQRCQIFPGDQNDGPAAMNNYISQVANLYWSSAETLKRELEDWNTPTCLFDDGRPRLGVLLDSYDEAFSHENDWSKNLARVEQLKNEFPNEAFVALAEAKYWINYAWDARGDGYASSVTNKGWMLLKRGSKKQNEY